MVMCLVRGAGSGGRGSIILSFSYNILFCCSVTKSCPTLCDLMDCRTPGSSVLQNLPSLLKFMSTGSAMLSNHLILCCPFLLQPPIFPSIRVFFRVSSLHQVTKYLNRDQTQAPCIGNLEVLATGPPGKSHSILNR